MGGWARTGAPPAAQHGQHGALRAPLRASIGPPTAARYFAADRARRGLKTPLTFVQLTMRISVSLSSTIYLNIRQLAATPILLNPPDGCKSDFGRSKQELLAAVESRAQELLADENRGGVGSAARTTHTQRSNEAKQERHNSPWRWPPSNKQIKAQAGQQAVC